MGRKTGLAFHMDMSAKRGGGGSFNVGCHTEQNVQNSHGYIVQESLSSQLKIETQRDTGREREEMKRRTGKGGRLKVEPECDKVQEEGRKSTGKKSSGASKV